jgi:hypothetical protein
MFGRRLLNTELPPHALFNQLTHMVLRGLSSSDATEGIAFPSFSCLSSLGIQADDSGKWLGCINTEKPLEELILAINPVTTVDSGLSNITLKPCVLRVDMMLEEQSQCGFGDPISLWSRVEEVHVAMREETLWDWFIQALSEPADDQHSSRQCYPLLRVLTVLYPYDDQDPEEKQEQVEELRDIQRGRKESGFRPLETLKIGWYHPCIHILTVPYAERRVIEWRDCLEGWAP